MAEDQQDLQERLETAEDVIEALRNQEVDAVLAREGVLVLQLRETQKALERTREELEQRVAERTAALARQTERLQNLAHELVSAEHRERKRVAAILHDELQQYLIAAKMQLAMTKRQLETGTPVSSLNSAATAVADAIACARDLTQQLRPPVLYEDGLVPALRWLAEDMGARYGLHVKMEAQAAQPELHEDVRIMLYESVRELLFNVVKHAGPADVIVQVGGRADRLCITVSDTGSGFDVEAEPLKDKGLGLFSIRERVELLGGEVRIESRPGAGTRVTLEMPLAAALPARGDATAGTARAQGSSSAPGPAATPIRVLLVDDHAVVREGLKFLLEGEGLEVVGEAADGVEALESVEALRPDVVLMDVNLPRLNGIEATREIRRRWPEIRVVGLSVQDDRATRQSMIDAGAVEFVSKADEGRAMVDALLPSG